MSDERKHSDGQPPGDEQRTGGGKRPPAKRAGRTQAAPAKPKAAKPKAAKSGADQPAAAAVTAKSAEAAAAGRPKSAAASLPAYGLAADVLARHASGKDRGDEETGASDLRLSDPERIFRFADRLSESRDTGAAPEAPTRITTWVTFTLAGEVFALPVEPVREILRVSSITRVPHAPAPIRGVSNVRGRVIPVIDLRLRIGLSAADLDRASRVVVVRSRGRLLGLLVDAVHQVVHLDLNQAQPPPEDVMTVQSDYISGVYHLEEQLVLLLDVERALLIRDGEARSDAGRAPGGAAGRAPRAADRDSLRGSPGTV
jgi:purine-binding chemotaxis protein CheW